MAELLRMPEVAAAATTAVLAAWPLAEGSAFVEGDPVVVVETDKAEVEVPAHLDGILLRTLVPVGAEVEVGSPIAVLGAAGEQVPDLDGLLRELGVSPQSDAAVPMAARRDVPDRDTAAAPDDPAASRTSGTSQAPQAPQAPRPGGRIFSSPLARRMAREAGLDISGIPGTGPGGRVVRRDVTAAIETARTATAVPDLPRDQHGTPRDTPAAAAPQGRPAGLQEIPHTRMRRTIADRLTASKRDAPHFYLRATCLADALLAFRAQINADAPVKVSVNDLLIKAIARAHTLVPEMNAVWTADAVHRFSQVDVSVAIATDTGLVTPVVRDVGSMSVTGVTARVREYADKARNGGLRPQDLEGGSITITNLGMFGAEEFTAIINPPQSAILAVGAARQEPVVREGVLEVATVIRMVLSVDHRPIDGVVAARWMRALTDVVENPLRILV